MMNVENKQQTELVSDAYLAYLKNLVISYIFGGKESLSFNVVVEKLKNLFSIDELILEGGGLLNGSFLNEVCNRCVSDK
ncbi:hypothetical protein GC093_03895 [Paenibacillus sp. LMG 31456]|uniref:Bacterial bifunctional deaminase-reductase C-terminal domain-containing protein n=1 Tax=Paenibacillus foliorum TaxID=2654974 RepID=A0A972GKC0_9BACL|nr:hypothetical protein [Paenibacillus foliorum]NOU92381.1 hypothetical protein [Paenibacillus foliorum]